MSIKTLGRLRLICAAASVVVSASVASPPLVSTWSTLDLKSLTRMTSCLLSSGPDTALAARETHREDAHRSHRVQIVGGVLPSATIAAQAGALDSARTAVAALNRSVDADRPQAADFHIDVHDVAAVPHAGRCR